jgi:NADH-quinone oxidoreductase subunit E
MTESNCKCTCSNAGAGGTQNFAGVCEILQRNHNDPGRLIPILQQIQEVYHYLPEEVLSYVATSLGLPPARVYGVATFYAHFSLAPKGKHVVKLCNGTACNVRGSIDVLEALREKLGLSEEKPTTDDMLFTVETVSCLGACGLAPVVVIDEDVHGQVTPEAAVELIEKLQAQEAKS